MTDSASAADAASAPIPQRTLGRIGRSATIFGLGGEGVLRTQGQLPAARRLIETALDEGVDYFDSAPAYDGCLDYLGAALGPRRSQIFLASKTHDRTRAGSLRLLEDTLRRLRTDYLDLWQLHDLRTPADLQRIFGPGGAIEALDEARRQGKVRHLGITGHHDPQMLLAAMQAFDFDAVLAAVNPADVHRLSFVREVLPEARRRGLAVIAMKVAAQGVLLQPGLLTMREALHYALSLEGVSTAIVGCHTPEQVRENARLAKEFTPLSPAAMQELEDRLQAGARHWNYYKRPA